MPTVIALHWNEAEPQYVVAEEGRIVTAAKVQLGSGKDSTAIGQRLAEALAPYSQGRAKVIVALGRGTLEWQHLSLPPCPTDELPEVVRLQADRDLGPADEDLGFDFLPLVGDEQTPHEVLTFALAASELAKIRQACQAANLTLERIVPLATGWPAVTQQASPDVKLGTDIFVAIEANKATLWATRAGRVVLFRQFQLAADEGPAALATAVGSALRRTLLALSQQANNSTPAVTLVSNQRDQFAELAKTLNRELDVPVQSLEINIQQPALLQDALSAPLAGFAMDESQGSPPLVDLLHPRQRPQTQIDIRTYSLAAAAAALLLALFGWMSYAKLHTPLNKAAADQAELELLTDSLDQLKEYELRAAAIRDWNAATPNLLLHLLQVSKSLRPKTLDDQGFAVDRDVVLEKLSLDKRQLTIDAMARNSRAVQPLEARLRLSAYRPQRIKSDPSETIKDYPWHLKSTIEITAASDNVDRPPAETSAETSTKEPTL